MNTRNFKIGILASGNLGLKCIEHCLQQNWQPEFIATDSKSTAIIELANLKKIKLFKGNPRNSALSVFLDNTSYNLILSINYLFIIEKDVIEKASKIINFHGSLLPKYRGRTPHVWAIINNETEAGITAHLIDEGCDTGDIILQKKVAINSEDTGADVLNKYQVLYPQMIDDILTNLNKIEPQKQNHNNATYFGKRSPEDGLINWNWQKERINNWVRAQAYPYPGAFTFVEDIKVTIDKISFCEDGFIDTMPNGLVLSVEPQIKVKTQNGVVVLDTIRENKNSILVNTILR